MKETKFLSIAIGILQGMQDGDHPDEVVMKMTAEQMYDALTELEKQYSDELQKNLQAEKNALKVKKTGNLRVTTMDGSGKNIPAQVKLFRLQKGETPQNFNRVNGRITMDRRITGFDGELICEIAAGEYVAEISCGSEYEIITDSFIVTEDALTQRRYELKRFADMAAKGWYAGDLHHHSIYSSQVYGGTDDVSERPHEVCNSMMAMGLSFGALSDHHNVLNHQEWKKEKRENFLPVISKEISTSNGHVMALGVEEDVIYRIPDDEHRKEDYLRFEFRRIVSQIKAAGGLAQLNHPRDLSVSISWNPKFYDMIDIFESMEIWNGSNPMLKGSTNDMAYRLWIELLRQGRYIPATTGSDTHNTRADDYNAFYDELSALFQVIRQNRAAASENYQKEVYVFEQIFSKVIPVMEKWAETNLTSGGVRTYVYQKGKPEQQSILEAIRRGHSFLTDGPVLIPEFAEEGSTERRIPGDHVRLEEQQKSLKGHIQLFSNRPLRHMVVYSEEGIVRDIDLKEHNLAEKDRNYCDYSMDLELPADHAGWFYFMAEDDCTNMAITNPVFLDR